MNVPARGTHRLFSVSRPFDLLWIPLTFTSIEEVFSVARVNLSRFLFGARVPAERAGGGGGRPGAGGGAAAAPCGASLPLPAPDPAYFAVNSSLTPQPR